MATLPFERVFIVVDLCCLLYDDLYYQKLKSLYHLFFNTGLQKTSTLSGNVTNELKIFCEICAREAHMMSASIKSSRPQVVLGPLKLQQKLVRVVNLAFPIKSDHANQDPSGFHGRWSPAQQQLVKFR